MSAVLVVLEKMLVIARNVNKLEKHPLKIYQELKMWMRKEKWWWVKEVAIFHIWVKKAQFLDVKTLQKLLAVVRAAFIWCVCINYQLLNNSLLNSNSSF